MEEKGSVETSVDSVVEEFVTPPSSPPPPPNSNGGWRGKITGLVGKITGVWGLGIWKGSQDLAEPQVQDGNTHCNHSNADKMNQAQLLQVTRMRKSNINFSSLCKKLLSSEASADGANANANAAKLVTRKRTSTQVAPESSTNSSSLCKKLKSLEASTDDGALIDNQHPSLSNVPITLRVESLNDHKVQNPLHLSRCSMSLDEEESTRDKCDNAIEDECVKQQSLFDNSVDEAIKKEHIQIGIGTEQAALPLVQNTADIANVLNMAEQMAMPCPKCFSAVIQPTCNNLRRGEVARDSFLIAPPEQAGHVTTIEGEERGDSSIIHLQCSQQTHFVQEPSGVLVDNQHSSLSNMPITLREESLSGHKVQNLWHVTRCSMSLDEEESTRDQCDKDREDESVKPESLFGNCSNEGIDKELIQIGIGTEQAGLTLVQNSADIANVLNAVEQMGMPCPKKLDTEILPICNNLRKGEAQDSFLMIAPPEQALHATTADGEQHGDSSITHLQHSQQIHFVQGPSGVSHDKQLDMADPFREALTKDREIFLPLPDLQSLGQKDEFLREGLVIGDIMKNIANVEDKKGRDQIDEPKCSQEEKVSALIDMEANGVALQPLQTQVQHIQRTKDNLVQADGELVQVDKKIIHGNYEDELLKSDIETKDGKFESHEESSTQMKKQLILLSFEKQAKVSSIAQIEKKIQQTQEELKDIKLEFERVATAPW